MWENESISHVMFQQYSVLSWLLSVRSIHLPKNTTEYPHITQDYPQRTCEYPWKTEKQIEFVYFPETTKNYQNLIKMITMKINGTISRHNSSYMFKIEKWAQKQQIIIAWLGIGKLVEVIKACYREARGSNQDQSRVINIINYFSKY